MYKFIESNLLNLENKYGSLDIELQGDVMNFNMYRGNLALHMTALYTKKELKKLIDSNFNEEITHAKITKKIGCKKVLESSLAYKYIYEGNSNPENYITFTSEDTTYDYYMSDEEFEALMFFLKLEMSRGATIQEYKRFYNIDPSDYTIKKFKLK